MTKQDAIQEQVQKRVQANVLRQAQALQTDVCTPAPAPAPEPPKPVRRWSSVRGI